ncbi:NUDIX hydrolase [Amycolatopsis sp. YIM 10]|uniref:NUDIX hydrolase n=1 Tax=Amycolatopsis sp. YIM 10 TaxID=2653857 RepID=UPI00129038A1|nr:NUDIX domain-containing protein [Amycolatopsis sp. YIM 10]QFU93594.1 Bifunctional NMN adenylyltransferase/Nudix hydrolase [Amycolatopsis sp. YIM 10]
MNQSRIRCVGGIALDSGGRLLLIRRANEPGAGLWSLPGGRVERDETDNDALIREMREETALEVVPGELVGMVERGPFDIYDYRCTAVAGALTAGDDASDARWVSSAEFAALERSGELVPLLAETLRSWNALPA